jgi:hypothetical protein
MLTRLKSIRSWSSEPTFFFPTRASYAFLVSSFLRFFTNNSGWTLPALFATLRDLRDLAFDVRVLPVVHQIVDIFAGRRASTGPESEE